ncbi:MAG TPA: isoprenylcysteine carboxylmethyltransferase family protein [Clostridiaceae bacterium]|nr:isoprenylcysteine carboxylmethyltransferase family protein [Clostridiaceae bacterium]
MQRYLALVIITFLIILVAARVLLLKRAGIKAMKFGALDRTDFLLPPFFLFYLYLLISSVFDLPRIGFEFIRHGGIAWIGVGIAVLGLLLFIMSMVALGKSFRVGIDKDAPGKLITSGIYAHTRNPIYVAFGLVFFGVFLIVSNWIFLLYLTFGTLMVNRQVLREEETLKKIYGAEYLSYLRKVPRYF